MRVSLMHADSKVFDDFEIDIPDLSEMSDYSLIEHLYQSDANLDNVEEIIVYERKLLKKKILKRITQPTFGFILRRVNFEETGNLYYATMNYSVMCVTEDNLYLVRLRSDRDVKDYHYDDFNTMIAGIWSIENELSEYRGIADACYSEITAIDLLEIYLRDSTRLGMFVSNKLVRPLILRAYEENGFAILESEYDYNNWLIKVHNTPTNREVFKFNILEEDEDTMKVYYEKHDCIKSIKNCFEIIGHVN